MSERAGQASAAPLPGATVMIIDGDELSTRRARTALRDEATRILACVTAREALALLPEADPDLVVASLDLPDLGGLRLVEVLRRRAPGVAIIATTRHPSLRIGVEAVRRGATDVLAQPVNPRELLVAADRALAEVRGSRELEQARAQVHDRHGFSQLLTRSPSMLRVFDQVRSVAATDATVLIRGETGTGKELVSRAIHERSRRRDKPFISVNCGAFTESLLESELFGHEKGSFTGAGGRRRGVFEMADGGTLFLDELGETSLSVQVNLLRVLEEMAFRRVGGHDLVHVDVRIIAATNVDLEQAVHEGRFRRDLYYRLNVFPIHLPPLRERPEDIGLLMRHFLGDAAAEYDLEPPTIDPEALRLITAYPWPGNVRQLRALCERWVIVAHGRAITPDLLPPEIAGHQPAPDASFALDESLDMKAAVARATEQIERTYLHRLLQRHHGQLQKTAQAAGITRRTLYTKMKAYGLHAQDYRRS